MSGISSGAFSPSSFLSFFDFPVVAATSSTSSSYSSSSSHSQAQQRPSSLFDLSCLQPDVNSPPIVTSPVPAAAPHSHFFPPGHIRATSSSSVSLPSSSSSPSLRSSLPSTGNSPTSPPAVSAVHTPPSIPSAASAASSGQGGGTFAFELSSLTSWLDSLFPAEQQDNTSTTLHTTQPSTDVGRQPHSTAHTSSQATAVSHRQQQQTHTAHQGHAAVTASANGRRPCRPRLSQPSSSPASSASLVRALSSHPKKPATLASSKADVHIAHPASSPMSIARASSATTRKAAVAANGVSSPSALAAVSVARTPPSPPLFDVDETVASLLSGGGSGERGDGGIRGAAAGSGVLSPLPEVQVVEALTPDSPSQVLTLDVHRTDVDDGRRTTEVEFDTEDVSEHETSYAESHNFDTASTQPVPFAPLASTTADISTLRSNPSSPPPPSSLSASLLSSALLEADLDYFHVERETAIAVEHLTSPAPRSPHSTDDTTELTWEDEEEEEDQINGEHEIVRLRGVSGRRSGRGATDEDDWEVCRVQEGGTDEEYEML